MIRNIFLHRIPTQTYANPHEGDLNLQNPQQNCVRSFLQINEILIFELKVTLSINFNICIVFCDPSIYLFMTIHCGKNNSKININEVLTQND